VDELVTWDASFCLHASILCEFDDRGISMRWMVSTFLLANASCRYSEVEVQWGADLSVQALAAVPIGFLRIVGLVLFWLLSRIAATERAKARLWQNQTMKYGPIVSPLLPPPPT